ncbi:MAG: hypothetical protein HY367_04070 [Candidatus Aenigmarchaeota archaeon]|nr:hypothetical protein [Candidatus Aenigmarchaeota archaeon]
MDRIKPMEAAQMRPGDSVVYRPLAMLPDRPLVPGMEYTIFSVEYHLGGTRLTRERAYFNLRGVDGAFDCGLFEPCKG